MDGLEGTHLLVVEDDVRLRVQVARALAEAGARVSTAATGALALTALGDGPGTDFSALVLDIGLPDADGRDVCQAIRARGIDVPVLMLTARDQLHEVLAGFTAGADDYVAKPFSTRELVVRLRALSRRALEARTAQEVDRPSLRLDAVAHALVGPRGRIPLTPTEFRVLATLMGAGGGVVRRRQLARAGWHEGAAVSDNTLDQYVARLRRKVGEVSDPPAAGRGSPIVTVHGVGYRYA